MKSSNNKVTPHEKRFDTVDSVFSVQSSQADDVEINLPEVEVSVKFYNLTRVDTGTLGLRLEYYN